MRVILEYTEKHFLGRILKWSILDPLRVFPLPFYFHFDFLSLDVLKTHEYYFNKWERES